MRKIITTNNQIEFQEVDNNGILLNSVGIQLGEAYFIVKGNKVSFYLNDSEKPFDSFIWSIDIPFYLDDTLIETPNDASAALGAIMNDSFQEQLDALQEELATEEGRAQAAEEALDGKIDDEIARAVSAETQLQGEITSMSATVATFDSRIQSCENQVSALTDTVNAEVTRATAKDAEHDTAISSLTTSVNNEIARALSAETQLHTDLTNEVTRAENAESVLATSIGNEVTRASAKDSEHDAAISGLVSNLQSEVTRAQGAESALTNAINNEIARATSAETNLHNEILDEKNRAISAETAIDDKVDAEIARSTAKDASQDALISGLTTSIQNEINRAQGAENSLRNDLNAETSARTSADAAQLQRITALEVGKADANSVYTKAESDAKYTTKDYISGLTEAFFDAAAYDSQTKKINFYHGNTIKAQIDATAFIKDGMVDNVAISGSNLVITFNTDAGKEPISIPLTDIFNPANYYTKNEVDSALSGKVDNSTFNTLSGRVDTISGDVITVSGRVDTISGTVETVKQEIITISGESYSKSEVDTKLGNKADLSAFTAHTADSTVHVTSSEKNTWNAKSDFSGSYNDLTDKPTIPSLDGYATEAWVSGYTYDKQTIDDKIAEGGTFDPTQYYNKTQTNALLDLKADTANTYTKSEVNGLVADKADTTALTQVNNAVTAHTANTTVHVTASEKSTWNNKSDFSGNYNDLTNKPTIPNYTAGSGITISNNVISAKIWSGTLAQYNALSTKDADTIYLIYNS